MPKKTPDPNPVDKAGIVNFYTKMPAEMTLKPDNPNFHLHGLEIPLRMCVCAPSSSGKTNYVLNLIAAFSSGKKGTFDSIHICTRNKKEPLYDFLTLKSPEVVITEGFKTLPHLDDYDPEYSSLVVIDDLVLESDQTRICEYFARCRKLGVSAIYLSQSFFLIPKFIRINCSHMCILKLSGQREVKVILSEFGLGVTKDQLLGIYSKATEVKLVPLLIDLAAPPERRFRRGFLEILDPADF